MEKEAIVQPIKMSDGTIGVRIIFKTFKVAEVIQESQNAVVILLRQGDVKKWRSTRPICKGEVE